MMEKTDEYRREVEQKMQARAERHIREHQAEQAEQAREVAATKQAQARTEHALQLHVAHLQLREETAIARRNRPTLIAQFRADPTGIRHAATLREVCLNCGSEHVRCQSDTLPLILACPDCSTKWSASACWSCTTGLLDTRDPETPRCEKCRWPKCAVCGACNPQGCSPQAYTASHRQRDEVIA
jgi:hypothetical protein